MREEFDLEIVVSFYVPIMLSALGAWVALDGRELMNKRLTLRGLMSLPLILGFTFGVAKTGLWFLSQGAR